MSTSTLTSTSPALDSLAGARVGAIGHGDPLARTLGQLHRLGASTHRLDDPYHAIATLARGPHDFDAIVLILPCVYEDELSLISAIRLISPATPVYLAGAEQNLSLLAAAVRLGATGLVTTSGIETLAAPSSPHASSALHPLTRLAATAANAPDDAPSISPSQNPSLRSAQSSIAPLAPQSAEEDMEDDCDFDESEQDNDALNCVPTDPIISAEELHALLHDMPPAPVEGSVAPPPIRRMRR